MILFLKNLLWSPVTVVLICVTAITLSFKTNHRALKHPIKKLKMTLLKIDNRSSFEATFTALGGTIGVGNTIGVAGALKEGGAGAVFWMLLASVFGMIIKESEIFLAVKFKRFGNYFSGPMYYIEDKIGSRFFAKIWAISCILTSFGMGNMSQTMAAVNSISVTFKSDRRFIAITLGIVIFISLLKGIDFIKKHLSIYVAVISVIFIFTLLFITFKQRENISNSVVGIFKGAFQLNNLYTGLKWSAFIASIRAGFSKGIFTNEAGLGSASIIHSTSNETDPKNQSAWGVVEVFIDTVLICTLTSIAILTCETNLLDLPAEFITMSVFKENLGLAGISFYSLSTLFFALASVLAWYCYAECALKYLGATQNQTLCFKVFFSVASILGGTIKTENILIFSDIFNGIMLLINISAMFLISNEAKSD